MQSVTGPGLVVAGRYELLDAVGHGAMGTVWRARDLRLTREVAVKEVRLPGPMSPQDRAVLRERSLREARVAARLSHPGVVTVHDVIESDDSPWIIMELVPSRSLAQVLAEDGPLTPARAAAMGVTLLDALGCAHAAGVVHRDVKPGNILMTPGGRVVLTDFGIATLHGDPRLTQAGMVMGTPGFCAPERIRGEPASSASDLWSLGATLYAAVEGRGPFEGQGSAMAVLAKIVHADPPPAASAGPLAPVIAALMNRDPAARPDAAAARRLLAAACSDTGGAGAGAEGSPGQPGGTLSFPASPAGVPVTGQQLAVAESGAVPGSAAVVTVPKPPVLLPSAAASPAPLPPAPVTLAPVQPTSARSAPVQPAPVQPALVRSAPVQPAPVQPALVRPAPVQPASARPAPAKAASTPPTSARPVPGSPRPEPSAPVAPMSVPPMFGQPAPGRSRAGGAGRSRAATSASASAEPLASKATQVPGAPKAGDPKRRPGRHRRALLFGGGGAA